MAPIEHGLLRLVPEGESWGVGLCGDIGPCAQAKKTGLWLNGDVRFTDPMLSCSKALYQRLSRQRSNNRAQRGILAQAAGRETTAQSRLLTRRCRSRSRT